MSAIHAMVAARWAEFRYGENAQARLFLALGSVFLFGAFAGLGRGGSAMAAGLGGLAGIVSAPATRTGTTWSRPLAWPYLPVDPRIRSASEVLLVGLPVGGIALLGALLSAAVTPTTGSSIVAVTLSAAAAAGAIGPWLHAPGPRRDGIPALLVVGTVAAGGIGQAPGFGWVLPVWLLLVAGLGSVGVRPPRVRANRIASGAVSFSPMLGVIRLVAWPVLRVGAVVALVLVLSWLGIGFALEWFMGHRIGSRGVDSPMFIVALAFSQLPALLIRPVVGHPERGPFDWLPVPSRQPYAVAMATCVGLGLVFGAVNLAGLPALADVYIGHGSERALAALIDAGAPEALLLLKEEQWHDPRIAAGLLLTAAVVGPAMGLGERRRGIWTFALFVLLLGGIGVSEWERRSTRTFLTADDSADGDPWQTWATDTAARSDTIRAELAAGRDRRALAAGTLAALSAIVAFVPRRARS